MEFVVLHAGEIIGTTRLDHLDAQHGYATGIFVPHAAFASVRAIFDAAPALHHSAFFLAAAKLNPAVIPFCQARDVLHLHLWRADGYPVAAQIVAIQFVEWEQRWTLAVHADDDAAFATIAETYRLNAAQAFADYTHPWAAEAPAWAHPAIAARAIQILERRTKNSPVLVGAAGERRRGELAGVVAAIHAGAAAALTSGPVVELDARLVHWAQPYTQGANLLAAVVDHARQQAPCPLFVIEQMDQLAQWSESLLIPYLARQQMQVIATATLDDYRRNIERSMGLQRRFQEIAIEHAPWLKEA